MIRDLFGALVVVVGMACAWIAADGVCRHFSVDPWVFLILWSSVGLSVAGSALRGLRGR